MNLVKCSICNQAKIDAYLFVKFTFQKWIRRSIYIRLVTYRTFNSGSQLERYELSLTLQKLDIFRHVIIKADAKQSSD